MSYIFLYKFLFTISASSLLSTSNTTILHHLWIRKNLLVGNLQNQQSMAVLFSYSRFAAATFKLSRFELTTLLVPLFFF